MIRVKAGRFEFQADYIGLFYATLPFFMATWAAIEIFG